MHIYSLGHSASHKAGTPLKLRDRWAPRLDVNGGIGQRGFNTRGLIGLFLNCMYLSYALPYRTQFL